MKRKFIPRAVLILAVCGSMILHTPTFAQENAPKNSTVNIYMGGQMLTRYCQAFLDLRKRDGRVVDSQQGIDAGTCLGFVEGAHDAESMKMGSTTQNGSQICMPANVDANKLAEVVAIFLEQNPALRNLAGYTLVMLAFANSYPCKQ